jgi:hypothetical protein
MMIRQLAAGKGLLNFSIVRIIAHQQKKLLLRSVEQKIKAGNTSYESAVPPNSLHLCQKYPGQRWKISNGHTQ